MKRNFDIILKSIPKLLAALLSLLIIIPLWMIFIGSFFGKNEITDCIKPILTKSDNYVTWHILAQYPTFRPYVELLLDTPEFFVMFRNSCIQVFSIIIGQLVIALPASWAFGRYSFTGKKVLFMLYIVLMILPFQVTMVSSHLVLDYLNLMNTHFAVILPGVFSVFPIFIISKFFEEIPDTILEAALIDGAGSFRTFIFIGIPIAIPGIISSVVLVFLEYWNAVEQPLVFINDNVKFPLSLYMPQIDPSSAALAMASSVIIMLPPLLMFFYGQSYLENGIKLSGVKG